MSKYYQSKREKMARREALQRFGLDGSYPTPWNKSKHPTKDFTLKVCPLCGTMSPIALQAFPGKCSRKSCQYAFCGTRRGSRN